MGINDNNIRIVHKPERSKEPTAVEHRQQAVFVKDTSKYWYKPLISREEAISILKDKTPGTFIVRDSNSYPGAYGLALKVAQAPPGIKIRTDDATELVRHFLIETTPQGVRLKGCSNEPTFGSLTALIYQHAITPMALPCTLNLPQKDASLPDEHFINGSSTSERLLEQGAACNVLYLACRITESLTGPEAIRRSVGEALELSEQQLVEFAPTPVHFRVSAGGITLTDNTRRLFFRRHYATRDIKFCGLDPDDRRWTHGWVERGCSAPSKLFGFVCRRSLTDPDNECHVFAELDPDQPAQAIVNFISKVLLKS